MLGTAALYGDQVKEIYRLAVNGPFAPEKKGSIRTQDILEEYLRYIEGNITLKKKLRVVVDGGNGTGGITAPELYRRLGAEVIPIFCDVDGRFPNHHPDPTVVKNLQDLIAKVRETGADLGIGLRRRRRPHRRRRRPRAHPLGRPAAGHLRPRHPQGPPGRHDHLRGQGLGGPLLRDLPSTAACPSCGRPAIR